MEVDNNAPVEPTVRNLKWRLKNDHRREMRYFFEIVEFTKNISNTYVGDRTTRQLNKYLSHELQLRRVIDYHVRRVCTSDNSSVITSALNEISERKSCFDEQYNFINIAISNGDLDLIFPDQLSQMSYERQRLLFKHIFKNNYPPHFMPPPENIMMGGAAFDGLQYQAVYEFEDESIASSDSDTDQIPALVPIHRNAKNRAAAAQVPQEAVVPEIQNAANSQEPLAGPSLQEVVPEETGEENAKIGTESSGEPLAGPSSFQQVVPKQTGEENAEIGTGNSGEDIDMQDALTNDSAGQQPEEQISQQDDEKHSNEKTDDNPQFPVVDLNVSSPECSNAVAPRPT